MHVMYNDTFVLRIHSHVKSFLIESI